MQQRQYLLTPEPEIAIINNTMNDADYHGSMLPVAMLVLGMALVPILGGVVYKLTTALWPVSSFVALLGGTMVTYIVFMVSRVRH